MQIYDVADVTGDGAAHSLAEALGLTAGQAIAKWFQLSGISIGSTPARVGSSSVSATRGIPIYTNAGQFAPPISEMLAGEEYHLDNIFYWAAQGDTLSIARAL